MHRRNHLHAIAILLHGRIHLCVHSMAELHLLCRDDELLLLCA
jgi:hypothetical protein